MCSRFSSDLHLLWSSVCPRTRNNRLCVYGRAWIVRLSSSRHSGIEFVQAKSANRTELLRRAGRIVGGGVLRLIHASLTVGGTSTGAGMLAPAARMVAA